MMMRMMTMDVLGVLYRMLFDAILSEDLSCCQFDIKVLLSGSRCLVVRLFTVYDEM
jgi:hypothetical protein